MSALDNVAEIRAAANALLLKADVVDRLPTPVDDLVAAAGLMETSDYEITESRILLMPRVLQKAMRSAQRKISGLIDRRERVIQIDSSLNTGRQKFVKLHEVTHDILPWQKDLLVLADTPQTLLPSTRLRFEREANQGAAELFFQLDFLARIGKDYPLDRSTPIILKDLFGSSIHAAFRHWVGSHHGCVCGFVLDKEPMSGVEALFKRLECVPSDKWRQEFGNKVFPKTMRVADYSFLGALVSVQRGYIDAEWTLDDLNFVPRTVKVQSFTNGYNNFVLVWSPERESLVARLRKAPRIVSAANSVQLVNGTTDERF